jgi:hypothetical protein
VTWRASSGTSGWAMSSSSCIAWAPGGSTRFPTHPLEAGCGGAPGKGGPQCR